MFVVEVLTTELDLTIRVAMCKLHLELLRK